MYILYAYIYTHNICLSLSLYIYIYIYIYSCLRRRRVDRHAGLCSHRPTKLIGELKLSCDVIAVNHLPDQVIVFV